jgi:hypothetical protein
LAGGRPADDVGAGPPLRSGWAPSRATQVTLAWTPDGRARAVAPGSHSWAGHASRLFVVNADGSRLLAVPGVDDAVPERRDHGGEPLTKGSYTIVCSATDAAGNAQAGAVKAKLKIL